MDTEPRDKTATEMETEDIKEDTDQIALKQIKRTPISEEIASEETMPYLKETENESDNVESETEEMPALEKIDSVLIALENELEEMETMPDLKAMDVAIERQSEKMPATKETEQLSEKRKKHPQKDNIIPIAMENELQQAEALNVLEKKSEKILARKETENVLVNIEIGSEKTEISPQKDNIPLAKVSESEKAEVMDVLEKCEKIIALKETENMPVIMESKPESENMEMPPQKDNIPVAMENNLEKTDDMDVSGNKSEKITALKGTENMPVTESGSEHMEISPQENNIPVAMENTEDMDVSENKPEKITAPKETENIPVTIESGSEKIQIPPQKDNIHVTMENQSEKTEDMDVSENESEKMIVLKETENIPVIIESRSEKKEIPSQKGNIPVAIENELEKTVDMVVSENKSEKNTALNQTEENIPVIVESGFENAEIPSQKDNIPVAMENELEKTEAMNVLENKCEKTEIPPQKDNILVAMENELEKIEAMDVLENESEKVTTSKGIENLPVVIESGCEKTETSPQKNNIPVAMENESDKTEVMNVLENKAKKIPAQKETENITAIIESESEKAELYPQRDLNNMPQVMENNSQEIEAMLVQKEPENKLLNKESEPEKSEMHAHKGIEDVPVIMENEDELEKELAPIPTPKTMDIATSKESISKKSKIYAQEGIKDVPVMMEIEDELEEIVTIPALKARNITVKKTRKKPVPKVTENPAENIPPVFVILPQKMIEKAPVTMEIEDELKQIGTISALKVMDVIRKKKSGNIPAGQEMENIPIIVDSWSETAEKFPQKQMSVVKAMENMPAIVESSPEKSEMPTQRKPKNEPISKESKSEEIEMMPVIVDCWSEEVERPPEKTQTMLSTTKIKKKPIKLKTTKKIKKIPIRIKATPKKIVPITEKMPIIIDSWSEKQTSRSNLSITLEKNGWKNVKEIVKEVANHGNNDDDDIIFTGENVMPVPVKSKSKKRRMLPQIEFANVPPELEIQRETSSPKRIKLSHQMGNNSNGDEDDIIFTDETTMEEYLIEDSSDENESNSDPLELRVGLMAEAFHVLKKISTSKKCKKPPIAALLIGEIKLAQKYEKYKGKVFGYTEGMGKNPLHEPKKMASKAVVFTVISLTHNWKIPIGLFFVHNPDIKYFADAIEESLKHLHESGINIISITMNCISPHLSFALAEELGAEIDTSGTNTMITHFTHPITENPIYIFYDLDIIIGLIKSFWNTENLLYYKEKVVNCMFCRQVKEITEKDLTSYNTENVYDWIIIRKRLSYDTDQFSSILADAMEYLKDLGHPLFISCKSTIQFLRILDLMSRLAQVSGQPGEIYKNFSKCNEKQWTSLITKIQSYVKCLKGGPEDTPAKHLSVFKTYATGVLVYFESLSQMYRNHGNPDSPSELILPYLLPWRLGLKHIRLGLFEKSPDNTDMSELGMFKKMQVFTKTMHTIGHSVLL